MNPDWYSATQDGCWRWSRAIDPKGYGRLRAGGRTWLAHRYSWTLHFGPIPTDLTIDHLCFERSCVNPAHLRLLTREENGRNQRRFRGPTCANGHLRTDESVRVVVDTKGRSYRRCRICELLTGRRHKGVGNPRLEIPA